MNELPELGTVFKQLEARKAFISSTWQAQHTEQAEFANTLIVSVSDGEKRAVVRTLQVNRAALLASDWSEVMVAITALVEKSAKKFANPLRWCRVEWVIEARPTTWGVFRQALRQYKRNYFRGGVAFAGQREPWLLITEMEHNANACFYGGSDVAHAQVNMGNLQRYFRARHGSSQMPEFRDDLPMWTFIATGVFIDFSGHQPACYRLACEPRSWGRRELAPLSVDSTGDLIARSTAFLARQVQDDGMYIYGYFPCFDRQIGTYNRLRHASSTYALLEGYEACRAQGLLPEEQLADIRKQIEAALACLCQRFIKQADDAAYVVDTGNVIKLGANAVAILAMVKFTQVMDDERYVSLLEKLALGITRMQEEDGSFVHVLNASDLSVKEKTRIIYYDGEAAFALMRLYGLTKDERWLECVVRAFDFFIANHHEQAHDHWLSYCSNELVIYRPERKYFEFAVRNVAGYVDFIHNRLTTFPTLLELSMAFHKMLLKLESFPEFQDVLDGFDVTAFYRALHARANYLVNGFFWPEMAMFYKSPQTIADGFFIRHHSFRVRIDDVEHYLSGLVAYQAMLKQYQEDKNMVICNGQALAVLPRDTVKTDADGNVCRVAWGGDVNLGRRQHFLTSQYGVEKVLDLPALKSADFSVINLECVVSVSGEQGRAKGEGGPFYYRARPEMIEVLRAAGVDAVTCANNHSGDYGAVALLEQAEILDAVGILHAGSGKTVKEAFAPVFYTLPNGVRVALFAVDATIKHYAVSDTAAGAAYLNPKAYRQWSERFTTLFAEARQQADVILVGIHWGANGRAKPDADEMEIGHRLIDAGADAILGASAHRLQGIEVYKGKAIIHDAGDLLFDAMVSKKDGAVFHLDISRRGIEAVRMYPVAIGYGMTTPQTGQDAVEACARFASLCTEMGTQTQIYDDGTLEVTLQASLPAPVKGEAIPVSERVAKAERSLPPVDYSRWQASKRKDLVLDEVPEDARIEPVTFGVLSLVGVRTRPYFFNRRRMLWVESFWQINEKLDDDLRIFFRGNPIFPTDKMRPWGLGADHDPCDWMIPTSQWETGKVYRDFYGLRPPYLNAWEDGRLQLEVSVITPEQQYPFVALPFFYTLHINRIQYPETLAKHMHYRQAFTDNIYEHHTQGTWNAEQVASITNGKWLVKPPEGWYVDAVVAGKKHVGMAEGRVMFVANSNANRAAHENNTKPPVPFDRHNQVAELQDDVVGAIVERPIAGLKPDFPVLQVADPIKAWMELGIAARSRFAQPIIAVTGSVGKSSTCQMIKTMMGDKHVMLSLDNYNSRVGVPGNLASLAPDYDAAVIEVAQSALWMQRGPITRFLRPDVAVITEIGLTQTHFIHSLEQAVRVKCKIFDGLGREAIAVVGAHLPHFDQVLGYAREHAKKIMIYGDHPDSEVRIKHIKGDYIRNEVLLDTERGEYGFTLPMPTMGMAKSAIAAFATIYAMDGDLEQAARAIEQYHGIEGRLQVYDLPVRGGKVTLIDDNYNAAFDSMVNAFTLFGMQEKPRPAARKGKGKKKGRRKPQQQNMRRVFVLGRLVDMGDKAKEIHQALAGPLLACQPDLVITHGDEMQYLREVLPDSLLGEHFSDVRALANYVRSKWRSGDVVLIKGSSSHSDFPLLGGLLRGEIK